MSTTPSFVLGEDAGPSLIVKPDVANDHTVLLATEGDDVWGVLHEGTREAPIPGITPLAGAAGESVRVYGDTETCEVIAGVAITAGDKVGPDSASKGQPAIHGFPYVGKAQADAAVGEMCRIQVERGIHDNSQVTITKTGDYTVVKKDLGATLDTTGAAGTVVFSLPPALAGYEVSARVGAAQELRLDPNGTETIAATTGVPGAAGKYLTANAVNERVTLKCSEAGKWDVVAFTGTWTHEA